MADAQQRDTLLADLALPKLLLSCQASESVKLAAELFSRILLHQMAQKQNLFPAPFAFLVETDMQESAAHCTLR